MKMRKIIAVLVSVLMLCSLLPLSAIVVSAAETPIFTYDFESGITGWTVNSPGTIEAVSAANLPVANPNAGNGAMKHYSSSWNFTAYKSGVTVQANTDYILSFEALATSGSTSIAVMMGTDYWFGGNVAKEIKAISTTEWQTITLEFNSGSKTKLYPGWQPQGGGTYYVDNMTITKKEVVEPETPEEPEVGEDTTIENLVVNGDFEAGLDNWTGNSGTRSIVTDNVHGGAKALQLSSIGQYGSGALSKAITVTPNKTYVIKWWAKRVSGSDVFNLYIVGDHTKVSGQNWMTSSQTGWTEYTYVIKPSVNAIQLKFSAEAAGNTSSILIDDVMLYEKPALENGGFETGDTSGWTVYYGGKASAEAAHSGKYGLDAYAQSWNGSAYQDIPVTNGKTYELSFWYKIIQDGFTYKVLGQTSGTTYVSQWYTNIGEWTQVKFQFLATDESLIRLNFCGAAENHNGHFYIDDVQLKELKDPSNDGYIKNGDFETGTNVGWTVHQSTTVNKASAKDGDYGMEVHGNGGWGGALQQKFNLQPNRDYILRFDAKAVSQGFNIKITDDLAVAAGTDNAKLWGIYFANTEWTNYEIIFNSGENTTAELAFVGSGINKNGDKSDDIVYLDNVSIEKVGGEDPIPNNNITGGQNSVSEDISGLAFRFEIAGVGAEIDETNAYINGSADIKLYKDRDDLYKLVKAGAIVTNNMTIGKGDMSLSNVDGKKTINIDAKYLCEVEADSFAFAVRIVGIPEANKETNIFARPYFIYEDEDGNEVTIYGNTKSENYAHAADPKASIKILAIGNSFSQDAMNNHLYQVLESAGYKEIVLGNLYIGGCDLDTHWSNMRNDSTAYTYYKTSTVKNGVWSTNPSYKISTAIAEEEWDYITIQQASPKSGQANSLGQLDNALNWINDNKTNPNAKILWHMTWAYDEVNQNSGYANYNNDQFTMYRSILDAVNSKVLTNGLIDGVIPAGTSIQNMRTSSKVATAALCESDGYHLSAQVGDYIAALTWYAYISGDDVSGVAYQPSAVANYRDDINSSVNGAIAAPYKVTKCASYDKSKSIKVLSIGHSFSVDVMGTYLYNMLEQAGYEDITIGYLYYPGCSLSRHWEYISTNTNGHERYGKNETGSWKTTSSPYAINVLRDEDWDYVTLQASPDYVGGENKEYSYIPGITNWIEENALNTGVEIKWHEIWAYSEGCDLWSYQYHNFDQMTMYNNIIAATKQHIVTDDTFTGIIPVGSAVQNARARLGDIFNEPDVTNGGTDGYHLNKKYGDFLGSLTWACYFSGVDAHTITERSEGMTEAEFSAIADAVNAALADWTVLG